MKPTWRIKDLIDLEFFFENDKHVDDAVLSRRDRDIFLKAVYPILKTNESIDGIDRKTAFRIWLENRRGRIDASAGKNPVPPGGLFVDILSLCSLLLMVAGVIAGVGLAFTVLLYQGSQPINVSTYLGVFVLLQIVLITLLAVFALFRRVIGSMQYPSVVQSVFGALLSGLFKKMAARAADRLSGEDRNRLIATSGALKNYRRIYGSVFYWPVFLLVQLFGVGFNLGALGGSLLKIMGSDLAFGWQSTIQFSSRAVYLLIETIALPWSFILSPPTAHPTYEQIQGSRMVLKEGIYCLTTPDLVSWWPFLLLAVCCYGFFPRILLLLGGMIAQKRSMAKLDLSHVSCNRLWRRMTTPHMEFEGENPVDRNTIRPADPDGADSRLNENKPIKPVQEALVLVPDDIFGAFSVKILEALIKKEPGVILKQQAAISFDFEEDQKRLSEIIATDSFNENQPIVVLQEAWQPPITETFHYFRQLRQLLGTKAPIHIFLIGKQTPNESFSHVNHDDWRIWEQAVHQMEDPFLELNGLNTSL
ncbi:DUF2868 domain-containing protein [Thermodesulfobacteriota bacterium]